MGKQLYIRKGNSTDTRNIIIIGEEQEMGSRDLNGYRPNKGSSFEPLIKTDKFSGNKNLTYVHATYNINLDTASYSRDYDVHKFVKEMCSDIVKWDGETNEGLVRSREAFISKSKDTQAVCDELYKRIETEVHGGVPCHHIFIKRLFKVFGFIISIPFRIVWFILKVLFGKKHHRRRRRFWN